jgi:hypothetical protein
VGNGGPYLVLILVQSLPSYPLALICAAVPWLALRLRSWLLASGLLLGILVSLLGAVLALPLYPWSNGVVLLTALTAGLLLGRGIPPRFRPFLILLFILSVEDAVQTALTGGFTPLPPSPPMHPAPALSGPLLYLNVYLVLPGGHYLVGIFDLLVLTAAAEHWRRRGQSYLVALLPGIFGFLLVYAAVWLTQRGGWPLIPFISAGWLCSAAAARLWVQRAGPTHTAAASSTHPVHNKP